MSKTQIQSGLQRLANHWKSLLGAFLVVDLLGAVAFCVLENCTNFLIALRWSTYLLTSTGLGSNNAETAAGQSAEILLMIIGPVLLLALITAAIVNLLRVDPDAFTDGEQKELLAGNRRMNAYLDSIGFPKA